MDAFEYQQKFDGRNHSNKKKTEIYPKKRPRNYA